MNKALAWIWAQVQAEPVAAQQIVQQAVGGAILFELPLSKSQAEWLILLFGLIIAFVTRRSVTPNVNVIAADPAPNPNVAPGKTPQSGA